MIRAENIHKYFGSLEVLKGVNLHIQSKRVVSIVGASGAGKTTLLQILGTLMTPDNGKVWIDGIDISTLSPSKIDQLRNLKIGFVFQFHNLFPEFTALENICIPAYIAGVSKNQAENRAMELLEFLNLADRATHKPTEMSGGEQQRVAVARALINNPSVIFADEPSGNLDSKNKDELHKLFFQLRDNYNKTIVVVTHDQYLANMSDDKLEIKDGIMVND